jgi:hypothetical protein
MYGLLVVEAAQQFKLLAEVLGKTVAVSGDLGLLGSLMTKIESDHLKIAAKVDAAAVKLDGRMTSQTWMMGVLIALNTVILLKLL